MKNEKSTLMDEASNTELLELKLEEARKLLRLKKKKLKQYDRRLEAKQHVQETLKRFQVVEESQNDETSLDSSSVSEPRSNESRSVKFSDDSPEVIFVTPTPDVYLSKKGRLKEKSKSKGYRSLSLSEKKAGNEEESQIKRIPPSDNSQTDAKRANHCTPSAESVVLEDKVNNNDNKETDVKDMFQSCEYNRNSSSPVLSQHSVINVRVDTQRRSGEDGIKHQNNSDNKKEIEGTVHNCRDGGSSPILSQRSVLSATGPMQRSDGGYIKLENDGMIDLENDFFDQDFSEVIEDKIISPKHSYQNKQIFDDSLNKWISEDSATSNCKEGMSDVAAKSPEDENKELNATFYFNSEWEENDIFEDSAIKKADIEARSIQRAKESPKKCTTKEEESQDLFSSILPTKYDGNDEPKKSYKSKLVLDNHSSKVPEMSKAHFDMRANGLGKENSLVSSNKRLVELNAGNEIEEENVHRRIRTNRVRHRLPQSSNSSDSNSELCKKELLGENVLRGTCSSLKENYQDAQEICSSGRKDLPVGVKSGNSDTIGNIVDPIDHITSVSCNQLETADTQLYSEVFNEGESTGNVSKDHKSHKTSQVRDEFIDCSSGVCKREDEKLNACISDVSPKSRSCGENSFSRKVVCAKQLFSKRLSSSSKAAFNENEFPCGGKGSGQCIPETLSITSENSNPLKDCDRGDMDGDLDCDERVSYFSLKPSDNLGKILSGSHGYFSPKPLERLYIVLVCELGISIWTRHSEDILKNGDNSLTNKER
ncbi:uncharacterized protein LOC135209107 [Macrobrachium nipponense]|uniref:uncharacterized protein LOC135209107 n=1 Tax=Macrobrachium nipponense TaxID=159736 RepID=UPI0030C859A9